MDPGWEPISWEEAVDIVAQKLEKIRQEDPRKLLVITWDHCFFPLISSWTHAFGTPNVALSAYRCGAALHTPTYMTNGTFHVEIDFDYCDYCILFGNQMGFGVGISPMLMAQKMAEARARGMKLVVVDPMCSTAAAKADEWIPIRLQSWSAP